VFVIAVWAGVRVLWQSENQEATPAGRALFVQEKSLPSAFVQVPEPPTESVLRSREPPHQEIPQTTEKTEPAGEAPPSPSPSQPYVVRQEESPRTQPLLESSRQGEFTYLAALEENEVVVAHRGWFSKQGRISILDARNRPMLFGGNPCPRSIYMHPRANGFSRVVFPVNRSYQRLETVAVIAKIGDYRGRQGNPRTPLTFKVLGDGALLWQSAPLQTIEARQACDISIKGVHALELRVQCPGADNWAIAAWLEPKLHFRDTRANASGRGPSPSIR